MSGKRRVQFDKRLLSHIKRGRNHHAKSMLNEKLAKAFNDFGTLLHYAALYNNEWVARRLIELGSDVNFSGKDGKTPLTLAVENNCDAVILILLEVNAKVDIVDADGQSALQMALDRYDFDSDIVREFVSKARFETRPEELAERLIAASCNMYHAANFREVNLMNCMLERGIDIDSSSAPDWTTALHRAAQTNDVDLAEWLMSNGADMNALDVRGCSALLVSALNGNDDVVYVLLERGADPDFKDLHLDCTPLFVIIENGREGAEEKLFECAELLLRYGAIPQNPRTRSNTIFDHALSWSSDKMIKMLVGQIAMLEMQGTPIDKSVMRFNDEAHRSRKSEFENFYELCQQVLTISVFDKLTLLDLLNLNETKMRLLIRRVTFASEVERVCSEQKLSELYSYYYNSVMKRIDKATRMVKLQDEAILVICRIFDGSYNQCYNFARKVVGYLEDHDVEQLVQVFET